MSGIASPAALTITRGIIPSAARVGIYGPEGIGKSTLAAQFPAPVFLDTEGGTSHLDVARFPRPKNWSDVVFAVSHLLTTTHGFQSLIIDSADWLEKLLAEEICRRASKEGLEDFGYGKGWQYVAEEYVRFLAQLDRLRDRGMNVVLIGHSTIRKFEAPDAAGSYDRYELKLGKQIAALTKEWVDALLFVNYFTKLTEKDGKQKAVGGRERIIYTTHTAAWDAKNRYGLEEKVSCVIASLAPIFARALIAPAAPTPPANVPAPAPVVRPGPVLLITREQVDKLDALWLALKKTPEDRAKAFAWVGCDSIDFAWDELTSDQAGKILAKLQEQLGRLGETSAAADQNGGAK